MLLDFLQEVSLKGLEGARIGNCMKDINFEQRKYGWSSLLFLWEIYIIKVSLSLSP